MPLQRRCAACQRQIADEMDTRVCTRCQSAYHVECWDEHGGCVRPDCQPVWWSLGYRLGRLRLWLHNWYLRTWSPGHGPIPWQIWVTLAIVFIVIMLTMFGTPMLHMEDLPNYTTR